MALILKLKRGDRVEINGASFAVLKISEIALTTHCPVRVTGRDGQVRVDKPGKETTE